MDINEQGMVVGNDSPGHDSETVVWRGGRGVSQAFRWTEAEGMTYAPSVGPVNIALGVNASGDIAGVGGSFRDWQNVLRSRRASGTSELLLTQAGGAAINDAGEIAGWGYFPGQANVRMFRLNDGQPEVIAPPEGSLQTGVSAPKAIDSQGNMVGYVTDADSNNGAAVLVRQGTVFDLNALLFDSPADPDHLWNLVEADAIHFDEATGTDAIVGWGIYAGVPHAFELILQGGTVPQLVDLKTLAPYDEPTSYIHIPIPRDINAHGEVVGSFHDVHGIWPTVPFVYVPYAPNQGMIKLNDLIDPESGWTLSAAFGINDNREVVGFGYLNGQARAYRMKLPDMTPCPVTDSCHTAPTRDLASGQCPATAPIVADGTVCQSGLGCGSVAMCQKGACACSVPVPHVSCVAALEDGKFVAVFGYRNDAAQAQRIDAESSNGPQNSVIVDGVVPGVTSQPTWFGASTVAAFSIGFKGTATWNLAGSTATARASDLRCQTYTGPDGTTIRLADGTQYFVSFNTANAIQPADQINPGVAAGKIDGSFSVTSDGAAAYEIPLWVPPGRAGLHPVLGLSYNSRSNSGFLGLGWALKGLSEITRCEWRVNMDGVSRSARGDDSDRFCLDGKPLVRASLSTGDGSEYRESETTFSRIIQHGVPHSTNGATFEVRTKDGLTLTYGGTTSTVVDDTSTPAIDISWSLSRIVDRRGNEIRYLYSNEGNEHRLDKIYYVFPSAAGSNPSVYPASSATRRVDFSYLPRSKPDKFFAAGRPRVMKSLIDKIEMIGPAPTSPGVLRAYVFDYKTGNLSGRDLLASITECDGSIPSPHPVPLDRNGVRCKRPTTFYYSDGDQTFDLVDDGEYSNKDNGPYDNPNNTWRGAEQVVDLNGDGLDDVLYAKSTNPHIDDLNGNPPYVYDSIYVYRLSDGTKLGPETQLSDLPAYIQQQQPSITFTKGKSPLFYPVDLDADGRTDVVAPIDLPGQNGFHDYYVFRNKSTSGTILFQRDTAPIFRRVIGQSYSDDNPAFIDLDGDGVVEVVLTSSIFTASDGRLTRAWKLLKANGDRQTYSQLDLPMFAWGPLVSPVRMGQKSGVDGLMVLGSINATSPLFTMFSMDSNLPNIVTTHDPGLPAPNSQRPFTYPVQWNYMFLDLNGDGLAEAINLPVQSTRYVYDNGFFDRGIFEQCPDIYPECHPFSPSNIRWIVCMGNGP
ncbi:MAG TPA: SpvB/TcaC N-terminal domain-containing protein [Gemmatimonadaceae bacterium]|nr:SpvB/TcaC N-terminal domain-containing protein [Gemmatimonadaceae bacterium]